MRSGFGAGVVGSGASEEAEGWIVAGSLEPVVRAVFEGFSASALWFGFASSSSRLRLSVEAGLLDPRCSSPVVESWTAFDDSSIANATRSLCLSLGFHFFLGRLVSRCLRWSS